MNGFTSGKATHDPEPWECKLHDGARGTDTECGVFWPVHDRRHAPRPKFDNHNPILVAFRSQPDIDLWDMGFAMFTTFGGYKDWEKDHHYFQCFTVATDHQIAHARRVLTKYAAVFL
jgi:hypothetical protein